MKKLAPAALALAAAVCLAGCGEQASTQSAGKPGEEPVHIHSDDHEHGPGVHVMPDGTLMRDAEMGNGAAAAGPSTAAAMICGADVRDTVQRVFDLPDRPAPLDSFADQTYRCTFQLDGGDLRLLVKDLDDPAAGRAWFEQLRERLPDAEKIKGIQGLGFPAFETARGDVGFLKDHKTLWVDASRIEQSALPEDLDRTEAAYAIAAAILACWTKHH